MPHRDQSKKLDFLLGTSIDGHTLLEVAGHGHYGAVFRASEPRKQATVAIKVLRAPKPDSPKEGLLRNELEALRRLRTSRNVTYLHQVIRRNNVLFLVMNYCDGGDLWKPIMDERRFIGDDALVSRIFDQMLVAVGDAHQVDIAHRDLKPENFLCDKSLDRIWLADFGLSTEGRETDKFGRGTPAYLPPEGWIPETEHNDAFRGDVFALGVTLFQMLYGEYPWCRAVPTDRHWDDFVTLPADFFQNCDHWAGIRGAPYVSSDARSLLCDVLEPHMESRLELAEFRRRFNEIHKFFIPTPSSAPRPGISRMPGLADDGSSESESDAGPATPNRLPSHSPLGIGPTGMFKHIYGSSGRRGRKVRQPSAGIRAWIRRLVVRQSSSASR